MSKIKRALIIFLAVVIILPLASCGEHQTRFDFSYQSKDSDYVSEMYYDDSLFDGPSSVYDPSLATASLSFAMASFGSMLEEDYANKSVNASDLLTKLGYGEISANGYFNEKPGTDSLGCVFGSKKIGGKTMIACGIRGSSYGAEWASNFTVGDDTGNGYHKGFYEGSEIFFESLKQYVADNKISGDIKLWIVGYSRAGAIANISSGRIDEAIRDGVKLFGFGVEIAKDDLYAYCFEAPQGVVYDDTLYPKSETFNNIFCIVNHDDVVTKVAMSGWSFTRYGVDKVLYDNMNDINFSSDIEKMKSFFGGYENSEQLGNYVVPDFEMKSFSGLQFSADADYCNWAQGIYLDDLLQQLSLYGIDDREQYSEKIQDGLREIIGYIYLKYDPSVTLFDLALILVGTVLNGESVKLLIDDIKNDLPRLIPDAKAIMKRALEVLGLDIDAGTVIEAFGGLLSTVFLTFVHDFEFALILPMLSKTNMESIGQAHQPELTLAFLRSLDPEYTDTPVEYDMSGRYYRIVIDDDDADASVLYNGEVIVKFENGTPVGISSAVPYGNHRELRIYLPYGLEYTVISSDDIELSYYDPERLSYIDCRIGMTPSDGTYTVTIPAAN
ncbi:MAG: hypothetical protein IJS45_02845 [Clostridia bacterium]|nr:hypothetical protein [Clostridia bacterium]